jgi:hypothetical protein
MKLRGKDFSVFEIILEAKDIEDWMVAQVAPVFLDGWTKREVMAELQSEFERLHERCAAKLELILKEKKKELRRRRRED